MHNYPNGCQVNKYDKFSNIFYKLLIKIPNYMSGDEGKEFEPLVCGHGVNGLFKHALVCQEFSFVYYEFPLDVSL